MVAVYAVGKLVKAGKGIALVWFITLANPNMKVLSYLFLPIALLYGSVLRLRHWFYDLGIFRSNGDFGIPIICVGNLNLGGTGKTPFTEFLIEQLSADLAVGVVSRGYGRKSKGFLLARPDVTAEQIGDEPLQIYQKYQHLIQLAVCEDRTSGINRLIEECPFLDVIILDDAFQHRKVKADVNILLSPYMPPFYEDFLLPVGKLRDVKIAAKRANVLVFTKGPDRVEESHRLKAGKVLPANLNEQFFYSKIDYAAFVNPFSAGQLSFIPEKLLVVTGIARPEYLLDKLTTQFSASQIETLSFADHHHYTAADLEKIAKIFDTFAGEKKAILTTEKDWVKLAPLVAKTPLSDHWLIAPIKFRLEEEERFVSDLKNKLAELSANANHEYL